MTHQIKYQQLFNRTKDEQKQSEDMLKQHFKEIEELTSMMNDEKGQLKMKKQLINEKIEKRALLSKFSELSFMKWTDRDRERSLRQNIYGVNVGRMPQRKRARTQVHLDGRFAPGEGLY